MGSLSIVIVNWNTGKLLSKCLSALSSVSDKHEILDIVVVDNHSSDGSYATAKGKSYSIPIEFKRLKRNVGFARANNFAIDYLLHKHGDHHILLLNPDTEVHDMALTNMLDALKRNPEVGIVGAKLLNSDGSLQKSVRRFPSFLAFVFIFLKLTRLMPTAMKNFSYSQESVVDQVMGAAFLIRDKALVAVGPLDERYWIWFEEVDYCKRALAAGWKTLYTPKASIMHHGGVSFVQLTGFKKSVPFLSSSLKYVREHISVLAWMLLLMLLPVSFLLTVVASPFHIIKRVLHERKRAK